MKQIHFSIIFSISSLFFLFSCVKDVEPPVGFNNRIDMIIDSIVEIYFQDARVYCKIIDIKNHDITSYGFCWDTIQFPTHEKNFLDYGQLTNIKTFDTVITGLFLNKTHYLRMYAVSGNIVAYSNQITFRTAFDIPIPPDIIETGEVTNITENTATASGIVLNNGMNIHFIEHGHCWSFSDTIPDISNNLYSQLGQVQQSGAFFSFLSELVSGTTYFVRAYGITSNNEIIYGKVVQFTTK